MAKPRGALTDVSKTGRRTNAPKVPTDKSAGANGPTPKESVRVASAQVVDTVSEGTGAGDNVEFTEHGEANRVIVENVATAGRADADVREQLSASDFSHAQPARKPVAERVEKSKERVERLVASLTHATGANLAVLLPALVETPSDSNLVRISLHRVCKSKQKDHVLIKNEIQARSKKIVKVLETSSSVGPELAELFMEYLNVNENESNIRAEYNKAAHISALIVVYADIAELKADSAAARKVLEDEITLLKDTYDAQAKSSEAKIAQLRSDLASANGKVTELRRVVAEQQVAIEESLAAQQELEGELAATKEGVLAGDVAWLDASVKRGALEQDLAATSSALATAKSQLLAQEAKLAEQTSARVKAEATVAKANKLAFGFGVFALLAILVLVLGMLIPQAVKPGQQFKSGTPLVNSSDSITAFDEPAFDSLQANKLGQLKVSGIENGSDDTVASVLKSAPLVEGKLDASLVSSLVEAVQAHEAREAGRVKATVEAPIKLAVSAEEMEKINATKVEVLALTNALDACVNIAGRVCFLGLKDAFTFNAAVEMAFAHEAIDVEEHEADHEAIVELIDAALASLDAKPAGAVIKSALVAHYVAFDRFEAFVSE